MSTSDNGAAAPAPTFDTLFESHFGVDEGFPIEGLGDTGEDGAGSTPADHDEEALSDDGDDTPGSRGRAEGGNTDDDEWDDEEGDEEDEDGDEPDTDDEDDDSGQKPGEKPGSKPGKESEAFFDRKEIDQIQDPEARKVAERAYKSMQRGFTQRMTGLAEKEKTWEATVQEAEAYRTEYEGFVQEIASDTGAEQFLHLVLESRPHVFTDNVLVSLALRDPERFEKVAERFQQLSGDDDAADTFKDKVQNSRDKYAHGQQDRSRQRQAAATQQQQLERAVATQAATHNVKDADSLEIIRGQVQLLLQRNRADQVRTTMADVNAVVDRVAKRLRQNRDSGRQEGERTERLRRQDGVREQAKRAKDRRPAPAGRKAPATRGEFKPPAQRGESSKALVDHFFGD